MKLRFPYETRDPPSGILFVPVCDNLYLTPGVLQLELATPAPATFR